MTTSLIQPIFHGTTTLLIQPIFHGSKVVMLTDYETHVWARKQNLFDNLHNIEIPKVVL